MTLVLRLTSRVRGQDQVHAHKPLDSAEMCAAGSPEEKPEAKWTLSIALRDTHDYLRKPKAQLWKCLHSTLNQAIVTRRGRAIAE